MIFDICTSAPFKCKSSGFEEPLMKIYDGNND